MPLCGFNQKMLEGLTSFHEGLVEHGILERAKQKGVSYSEILNQEIGDMKRFLGETSVITNPLRRELIENLTRYASAFYSLVEQKGVDNFEEIAGDLTKFYWEMDRKYYSELEGQPDSMKQLAEHLNTLE